VTPAQRKILRWRENPNQFVHEVFGVEPDQWQSDALDQSGGTGRARRRVMMKSATGVGKSAVLAWIGWHRLMCFAGKGDHPKGAALSGEGRDNLRDNLWAELAKWRNHSDLIQQSFEWTKERIFARDHPETWFLSARSYAKDANIDALGKALSGLHSGYPFILLDETGNMPMQVGQKATQIFTGGTIDGLIAGAGNPTSTGHLLYNVATHERELWCVITVTADPEDPKRSSRVDPEHAQEQIDLYGRENPWVMATILGQFPPGGINTLLGPDEIEAAMNREIPEASVYDWAQKRLGVDVARFGNDRTVVFPRQGMVSFAPEVMRIQDTCQVAARVVKKKLEWKSEREFIDDSGHWGHGVLDNMKAGGYKPTAVLFEDTNVNEPMYYNRRAEMWANMADWVKGHGVLPKLPGLIKELSAPTYTYTQGKFLLEPKDLIKKRIGSSPDLGDGLCLTFAEPDMPSDLRKKKPKPKRQAYASGGQGWMG